MEVDSGQELLAKLSSGELIDKESWPSLREDIVTRLEKIAHNVFPIPNLPPPPPPPILPSQATLLSPLPSSPLEHTSSQYANKENQDAAPTAAEAPTQEAPTSSEQKQLPKQLADMLTAIKTHLAMFESYPPHTIQRLAELILDPRKHYKALASYLHAVDRVVQVTSGTNIYPLPPAVPDMSTLNTNGEGSGDPATAVSWGNPTAASVGSDEALGGALLTPIPWLTNRTPENGEGQGAQIHSESTETISGPNGMGSIETVSVSINGVSSTGHSRGVTQGELLRQEQRAGVVPVSQLPRHHDVSGDDEDHPLDDGERQTEDEEMPEEDETPHARGPEDIGVDDTGPQGTTTSYLGEGGMGSTQGIDVEAAVGRKHTDDDSSESKPPAPEREGSPDTSSASDTAGTKREAEQELEGERKKLKEDQNDGEDKQDSKADADGASDSKVAPDTLMVEEKGQESSVKQASEDEDMDTAEEPETSKDAMDTDGTA